MAGWRAGARATLAYAPHWPARLARLIALTDPDRAPDPAVLADRLPSGSALIYRTFGARDAETVARRALLICRRRSVRFLIAGDPNLAARVNADGVHVPERDQALITDLRRKRWDWMITSAAHSARAVRRAAVLGADAALLSKVFASKSASHGQPMGAHRWRAMAHMSPLPVYALGGVSPNTLGRVATHGGLAMIDAINPG